MKTLGKYSFGIGDRFSHEGKAQLSALIEGAGKFPFEFVPVWNKSNREHQIIGTEPSDTRREADEAVKALGYGKSYFVDAETMPMPKMLIPFDWDEAKDRIRVAVRELAV